MNKLKKLLQRLHVYKIVDPISSPLSKAVAFSQLLKWIATNKKALKIDRPDAPYESRYELYRWLYANEIKDTRIDYFEFGVADAETFYFWLDNIHHPDSRFYGFDTFTGLPENWGTMPKGSFSMNGQIPEVTDNRGTLYKGLFQETLWPFLQEYKSGRKKVILLDADLYSSTLYVLTTMAHHLNNDDLIIFDEFFAPRHEFLAYQNFSQAFPHIQLIPLGAMNNYNFIAFKVHISA